MTSLEIAELTGKMHKNVLSDCRNLIHAYEKLYENQSAEISALIKSITYIDKNGDSKPCFSLNKLASFDLVTGYSIELRHAIHKRWRFLEEQLEIVKFRQGDKKHQLNAMEALSHLLPEDLQGEALSYIKANTVVNKAVSNLFGFPKMLKKDQMSPDMLGIREKILDDYIKLYDVLEDNGAVKDILYSKYQPKRLESSEPVQTHAPLTLVS